METADNLKALYRVGGIMAIIIVILIPIQMAIFIAWPPPSNVLDFFELFNRNWFLGLLSLDLLYILNNILLIFVYLGLFFALRKVNQAYMLVAVILGLVGITSYYASTAAFEMLSLSNQFAVADNVEMKSQLLAAGMVMLETYKGTAFDVYYVLNAITLIIISRVMFQDNTFSRSTAVWGLISGILMIMPTTAGTIGLTFGIASLVPWTVFSILIAKRFFRLYHHNL